MHRRTDEKGLKAGGPECTGLFAFIETGSVPGLLLCGIAYFPGGYAIIHMFAWRINMYMVAGLGNPGRKYDGTRHNCGFETLDILMKKYDVTLTDTRSKAFFGKCIIEGQKTMLVKPQTYMNLSGDAIRGLCDYYKIDPENELIVICDDISLVPGNIRVRSAGSAGGHNGLKDIIAKLGTDAFTRVRIGVGEKPAGWDLADFVLGHFSGDDVKLAEKGRELGAEAIERIISGESMDKIMSRYNVKQHPVKETKV